MSEVEKMRRLNRWALQSAARELMPREGVSFCLRRRGFDHDAKRFFSDVQVLYAEHLKRAHYGHLFICGSPWMCPICSAKISERRRVELAQAIENSDFHFALASFTLQHSIEDSLKSSLDALLHARHLIKRHRAWENFKRDFGIVGTISSLETTYGVNGHHPHSHNLLVARRRLDAGIVHDVLFPLYRAALSERDRSATAARGLDVRTAQSDVALYISKFGHEPKNPKRPFGWTIEHELTKSVSKMSRGDHGFTPLDLLQAFMMGDQHAGKLWQEYAGTFKGRHQLQWSKGLRSILGLGKAESDLEIAQRIEEPAILLATLSLHQWQVILGNDARGEVLEIASSGDPRQLQEFLHEIGADEKHSAPVRE
jgi:hypothetical protein